jgi:hypothetical protein
MPHTAGEPAKLTYFVSRIRSLDAGEGSSAPLCSTSAYLRVKLANMLSILRMPLRSMPAEVEPDLKERTFT